MTTSWFGVSGSEDLGGGLSALFTLQSFMRADTGASGRFGADTFWARNAFVGLASNSLGKVTDRPQHHAVLRHHAVVQSLRRLVRLLAQHPPLLHQRHADGRLGLERLGALHQPEARRRDAAALHGRGRGRQQRAQPRRQPALGRRCLRLRFLLAGRQEGRRDAPWPTPRAGRPRRATTSAWPGCSASSATWPTRRAATSTTSPAWVPACRWATARSWRSGARSSPRPAPSARPSRPAMTTSCPSAPTCTRWR